MVADAPASAWGFTCGMGGTGAPSWQLRSLQLGLEDPAPIPSLWVFIVKALGTTLAAVALAITVRGEQAI